MWESYFLGVLPELDSKHAWIGRVHLIAHLCLADRRFFFFRIKLFFVTVTQQFHATKKRKWIKSVSSKVWSTQNLKHVLEQIMRVWMQTSVFHLEYAYVLHVQKRRRTWTKPVRWVRIATTVLTVLYYWLVSTPNAVSTWLSALITPNDKADHYSKCV